MDRLFGTDGIRGIVGELFTPEFVMNMGLAIGSYLNRGDMVVLGTDTRCSNEMLKTAMLSGLIAEGINVKDLGITPTPAIQYATHTLNASLGVIITASHNPPDFNGIKCIDADGTELPRDKEEMIEKNYFNRAYREIDYRHLGRVETDTIVECYVNGILSRVDVERIKKAKFRVVIDNVNGAGCFTTPLLLEKLGCEVVSLNSNPTGIPAHNSEPTPENLKDLICVTKAVNADIGIAHDGDADRAVFIDEKGVYVPGEKILAYLAYNAINENNGGVVVTAISSSTCVEDMVKRAGGEVKYTKVGSPVIARVMKRINGVFGGEENGGLIFPQFQYCRDGGMAIAKMLEILAKEDKKLSECISMVPQYAFFKTKVSCAETKKRDVLNTLIATLNKEGRRIVTIDGAKIYYDDGWVLVRPSGTEPLYRIFAEAKNEKRARELAEYEKNRIISIIEEVK